MKFQAATTVIRKLKTGVSSSRAAMKRLTGRVKNTLGIREKIIKQKAESNKMQSQTHRKTKGTSQSPARSEARRLKNLESGKASTRH